MSKAFDQSIIENLSSTRRYARALIGDEELANEAVMHAATRMMKISVPWVPEKMVRLWLVHLVHNYIDEQRKAGHFDSLDDSPDRLSAELFGAASTHGENDQLIDRVDGVLQNLSEVQRRIYLLIAIEMFAVENVARVLKMPIDSVLAEFESVKNNLSPPTKVDSEQLQNAA